MSCLLTETYCLSLSLSVSEHRWPIARGSRAVWRRQPWDNNAKGLRLRRSRGQRATQTLEWGWSCRLQHRPFASLSHPPVKQWDPWAKQPPSSWDRPSCSSSPWISCVCGVYFMTLDHANMLYAAYWQEDWLPWSHLGNYAKISRETPFRVRYGGFSLF